MKEMRVLLRYAIMDEVKKESVRNGVCSVHTHGHNEVVRTKI